MENNVHYYWKNFRLGTELQAAGSFIYNALFCLENMQSFYWEHECFEFLYNLSVGIERLEKISIIMLEHNDSVDQAAFEKSLITHSHQDLIQRVKKKARGFSVNKQGNLLLEQLQHFYNSARYDSYNLSSVYKPIKYQEDLVKFVSTELKIEIKNEGLFTTPIDDRMRKFLGKVISKLAVSFYKLITAEAHRLNMYTYEIVSESKGFKIFIAQEYDFIAERRMQREVFLYLHKKMEDSGVKRLINQMEPVEFGQLSVQQYLQSMFSYHGDRQVMDELETIEEDERSPKSRIDNIMVIGTDATIFIDDDDDSL